MLMPRVDIDDRDAVGTKRKSDAVRERTQDDLGDHILDVVGTILLVLLTLIQLATIDGFGEAVFAVVLVVGTTYVIVRDHL